MSASQAGATRSVGTNVVPIAKASRARAAELEFLPAALEIVETPASPVGRALGAVLIGVFVVGLIWATFGHIDIIATAQGKIVPVGRTKVIQPIETGMATAIHVRDGDQVKEGQVLIEFDQTSSTAERNRIRLDLMKVRLDIARLTALRTSLEMGSGLASFVAPMGAPPGEIARTQAAMTAQWEQQAAKLVGLDRQIEQKRAEAEQINAMIDKLKAGLPILEETAVVREKAMGIGYGNRITHLEAQLRLTDQRNEVIVQERRAIESLAARQALEAQREQTRAEYVRAVMTELSEVEPKAAQYAEDLVKAEKRMEDQVLRAPIAGTVQQLVLYTIGGVVTPAQALMVIVPDGGGIEVEAMIQNKDIGFVHDGDPAEIKIDTFNFTLYGLLQGKVLNVSQDAVVRDKPPAQSITEKQGSQSARSSKPAGQELLYTARVSLDRTRMQIDDRLVNLTPGMAVTVEIKTGQRRIVEFLLSPLLRYKQESLRER